MTLRCLISDLLDCGVDDLDAEVITFHEECEAEVMDDIRVKQYVAIQDDYINISKNGNCVQILLHNRPFREVK